MKLFSFIIYVSVFCFSPISKAGIPLYSFTPDANFPPKTSINASDVATVRYTVTNNSSKAHQLVIIPQRGLSQESPCILGPKGSSNSRCTLSLTIRGSELPTNGLFGGPRLCQTNKDGSPNVNLCYQPSRKDILEINLVPGYTVGGSVFGLIGTLGLENNGGDSIILNADGSFTFPTALISGDPYFVSVQSQPATQTCTVSNGSGIITNANVTNVMVNCSTNTRTVGGTVTGLSGTVVLQNNNTDDLTINADGSFTFSTPVAQGSTYNVTVLTQPATQTCTVSNGSGTVGATNITNVLVTCSTNAFTVGGTVTGLSGSVTLQNNNTDNLTLNANGSFTFSTPVAQGAPYNVTILTQPATQTCSVTNGSGTMGGANVTNVGVNCVTNTLTTSIDNLALSITGITEYGISGTPSSGLARIITISNPGAFTANNLVITPPTWPSGTTSSTTCGASLAGGSSCTITVTPGNTATSNGTNPCTTGTAPVPGVINVTSSNASGVSINVVVLGYGCIYQTGYVYAFDDTTPSSQSVGGKIVTTGFLGPMKWDVDPACASGTCIATGAWEVNIGLDEASVPGSTNPAGAGVNGPGNTYLISSVLNGVNGNTNGPPANYAAGACVTYAGGGYTDWYLQALCEMTTSAVFNCGIPGAPTLQNIESSLVDTLGLFFGNFYWSSSESSSTPTQDALIKIYGAGQGIASKGGNNFRVQCSRLLTTT